MAEAKLIAPSTRNCASQPGLPSAADWFGTRDTVLSLCAGAIAGGVSRTVTSPLERLKVMRQVQSNTTLYGRGVFRALYDMARNEGIRAWWKGNGTNVVRIAPTSAVQFCTFDLYRTLLVPDDGQQHTIRTLTAGGLAGATAATICYPLDLVRSFLSVQVKGQQYHGIVSTLQAILKTDGVRGLYRGLFPTLAGISPYIAINFTTFDYLKRRFLPSPDHSQFALVNLGLGACAGGLAATITYPTDLIRRRMQMQGFAEFEHLPKYANVMDCITQTVKTEGVGGLYKGMVPCWLKVVPAMAVAFTTFELCRKSWGFRSVKKGVSTGG